MVQHLPLPPFAFHSQILVSLSLHVPQVYYAQLLLLHIFVIAKHKYE